MIENKLDDFNSLELYFYKNKKPKIPDEIAEGFSPKAIDEAKQLVDMLNNNQDARRALEYTAGISPDEKLKKEEILNMDKEHVSSAIKAAEMVDGITMTLEGIKLLKDLEKYLKK